MIRKGPYEIVILYILKNLCIVIIIINHYDVIIYKIKLYMGNTCASKEFKSHQ